MGRNSSNILLARAELMSGKICWSAIAGPGTGSQVTLRIGKKIPFKMPLINPNLSEDERLYDGEFWIHIQDAAWILLCKDRIVCSNESSNEYGAEMVEGLNIIRNSIVTNLQFEESTANMTLFFGVDVALKIFVSKLSDDDSYSFGFDGEALTVGPGGQITTYP